VLAGGDTILFPLLPITRREAELSAENMMSADTKNPVMALPEKLWAPLFIVALIVLTYASVLSSTFGMDDDYNFLNWGIEHVDTTFLLLIAAGRPINGKVLQWGFGAVGSIENLVYLRAITLTGIGLLAIGLFFFCRKHRVARLPSLVVACGIILLPSFQIYAAWAQHFTTPYTACLGLLSAFLVTPACRLSERSRIGAIIASALLLAIALLVYQPIAMFFCTGILISILAKADDGTGWNVRRLMDAAIAFVVGNGLGFLIFKFCLRFQSMQGVSDRGSIALKPVEKLAWFFKEPLRNALSLYKVSAKWQLQLAVLAFIALAFVLYVKRAGIKRATLILVFAVLALLASYLPNMVVAENWASYRTLGALAATMLVLVVFSATEIFRFIREIFAKSPDGVNRFALGFALLALLCADFRAQSNLLNGLVLPLTTELNNLTAYIDKATGQKTGKMHVQIKPASYLDSSAVPMAYDEFGIPTMSLHYDSLALVKILLRNKNIDPGEIEFINELPAEPNVVKDTLVINSSELATSQRFKSP
jgi:hypothetical protein